MNIRQVFLIVAAIGLAPIALSYGLTPQKSLSYLFQIPASDTNSIHIFRAIMGLYLALVLFWLFGAMKTEVRQAALYSLVIFMLGLALGRVLSIVLDGFPHPLLTTYLVLELFFGAAGIIMLRRGE